jgi:2-polyprenyl-6-methoxyphenol hydroxylase-like FAD-dependent oxidoreductase
MPTVVISGAGIAGPALAFWLTKIGYHATIVELADGIRPGGQTVDLRGAGGDVVTRMGLIDQMRQRSLDQRGVAWIKGDGRRRAEMPVTAFHGNGLVSKLEILRGDLVDVLYQATKDHADYRFGTLIEELKQADDAVHATLSDGTTLTADLAVGCDGPHSAVRRLVFGPEERFVKPLGGYNAWFTAPDTVGLDGWYLMYQAPGLNASMRPSHDPALCKAGLAFRSGPLAGYCASPLSGMGTSLALVGAYVLAGELGPADSLGAEHIGVALRNYEAIMRPYIDRCRDLPNGIDGYLPKSASDIAVTAQVMKWMQRWPFRSIAEKKWFTTADAIDLPNYVA